MAWKNHYPYPGTDAMEERIILYVKHYMDKYGWSPSVREIAEGIGYEAHSAVHERLRHLHSIGRVVYNGIRQLRVNV